MVVDSKGGTQETLVMQQQENSQIHRVVIGYIQELATSENIPAQTRQ